ncbi:uridine kinase [Microbacterium horticulturae]|uniref:Uridine kinase n=1 Tax=Microbacterium horticulturae TaxID=3028316 RepID=A0ABY8BW75_9MICO|nr:uridine kinase [Microbacterium sp. KACC 23027]WEG07772.1 uridine kinase [Microbacterium sp. KACC 23027]
MRLPITPANTLLRGLRDQLRQHHAGGRLIVAVDALPSTPTVGFADAFAAVIAEDGSDVFRASADGFLIPRGRRRTIEREPAWVDEETFRRVLVDPFRNGAHTSAATGFQLQAWDEQRDQSTEARWVTAGDDAVLLVDGPFLNTPSLRGIWHFSVWLEIADRVLAMRPGRSMDAPHTRVELSYLREEPVQRASALVDITDPQHPVQVFRDSC